MTGSFLTDDIEVQASDGADLALLPPLQARYDTAPLRELLADPAVLGVIGFGTHAPAVDEDPRYLNVPLDPVGAAAPYEVWRGTGTVRSGRDGEVRWTANDHYSLAVLEVDEASHGGIAAAACHAYRALGAWLAGASAPHVLRIWNYLDAINEGDGDSERYREFCRGRAEGMRGVFVDGYPAATAIGTRDGRRILRMYWITARVAGTALENPRQVSAWRYPRQYGPNAPTFARAMHAPTLSPQLYISGTAAIVGHASHHHGDFGAQLGETLANLGSLLGAAGFPAARRFGTECALKMYVRAAADAAAAAELLRAQLPAGTAFVLLHGDICRRELLIEIDGIQTG